MKYIFILLILSILVSLLMHTPNLKTEIRGVHNWRQSQTAWNIRNFVRHDANILNPRISNFNNPKNDNIYRYEFPIMQWSIAMVQKVFGEHVTIMRLSIFLLGALTIIGFFFLLKALDLNDWTALIGAILLQFSPVFYYYSINPIPDNLALTGAVWYLYLILKYFKKGKNSYLIGAAVSLLIATWAKLPFLMFSIGSIVYFFKEIIHQKKISKGLWILQQFNF
ncbi:MAG: glycosyltransferase family 39 protein [Saprospiraceae bacterium]|nr:glycosyltransferase family 39 protein [Saprospiraceae bacterium]